MQSSLFASKEGNIQRRIYERIMWERSWSKIWFLLDYLLVWQLCYNGLLMWISFSNGQTYSLRSYEASSSDYCNLSGLLALASIWMLDILIHCVEVVLWLKGNGIVSFIWFICLPSARCSGDATIYLVFSCCTGVLVCVVGDQEFTIRI